MNTPIAPVATYGSVSASSVSASSVSASLLERPVQPVTGGSFSDMLLGGVNSVEQKVASADAVARAFMLDDSVPVHQVTYALEQASLSLELMMQVRGRLIDAYQQLMGMQL